MFTRKHICSLIMRIAGPTLILISSLCLQGFCEVQSPPSVYTDKVASTPDMLQTDPGAGFDDGGKNYCAPVAVSNSLMWLAGHGYGRLCPKADTTKRSQIAIVKTIANVMNPDQDGTSAEQVLRGVEKYVSGAGYLCARLEYQGWRPVPERYSGIKQSPSLEWMQEIISNPSGALWLNIGFYTYNRKADAFKRISGHWVTAVGYGVDAQGKTDPSVIVIHDPAARSGKGVVHNYGRLTRIAGGTLSGNNKGLPHQAEGYYKIQQGVSMAKGADIIVIDGAVGMVLGR